MKITLIAGTNREGSWTLRVANRLAERYASHGVDVTVLDLRELPQETLSPTAYASKPEGLQPFFDAVLESDGLVVVTPEYNGGMPGVLKLFIDMLPFPHSFEHRPVCFVGLANGRWGALRPVEQLQAIFGYRNAFVYPDRIFLPGISNALDEHLDPVEPLVAELLTAQITGYVAFCEALKPLR